MNLAAYIEQELDQGLNLAQKLDLSNLGDRAILTSRILLRVFHTDGIIHEGKPAAESREKFKPFSCGHRSLNADFVDLLARYYEVLAEEQSPAAAQAWYQALHEEFQEYLPVAAT